MGWSAIHCILRNLLTFAYCPHFASDGWAHYKAMILTWLLSIVLTVGMNVSSDNVLSEQAVVNIRWTFQEISPMGNEIFQLSPELNPPHFVLTNGQLQGSTGCKAFSGIYSLSSTKFIFSRLSVAKDSQHCTDAQLSLEADLLTILDNVQDIGLEHNRLKITGENGRFVVFTKKALSDGQ